MNINGRSFPASDTPIRIETDTVIVGYLEEIPLYSVIWGQIQNLPPEGDDYYIVSRLVKDASQRSDFLVPHGLVRENGIIVGCEGLAV